MLLIFSINNFESFYLSKHELLLKILLKNIIKEYYVLLAETGINTFVKLNNNNLRYWIFNS